jgi:ABC-2 type transport system ATP-binding protein
VLKARVGAPTLTVFAREGAGDKLADVLAACGDRVPAKAGSVAIRLPGGAADMARVVRALDDAGVIVDHMELDAPSLDDVFAEATGRRLEGAQADGHHNMPEAP